MIDNEIIVGGENGNNFSLFFVNYYENFNMSLVMVEFVKKQSRGKWELEWYNPAYMVAFKQW